MNRRAMLSGAVLFCSLPGCLAEHGWPGGNGDGFDPDVEPTTRLGAAGQASIRAEPEREYEYVEETDEVRVTYASGSTNEMPFDEWGTRRATSAAVTHVGSLLEDEELLGTGVGMGAGKAELEFLEDPPPESEFERDVSIAPIVHHTTVYSRDGELIDEPAVEFDEIVAATPRSVAVTMRFDEREYDAVLPVFCRREWIRQD